VGALAEADLLAELDHRRRVEEVGHTGPDPGRALDQAERRDDEEGVAAEVEEVVVAVKCRRLSVRFGHADSAWPWYQSAAAGP
jgi:hypothetical protein